MSNDKVNLISQGSVDGREVGEIKPILRERLASLAAGEVGIPLEEVLRDMRMTLVERLT